MRPLKKHLPLMMRTKPITNLMLMTSHSIKLEYTNQIMDTRINIQSLKDNIMLIKMNPLHQMMRLRKLRHQRDKIQVILPLLLLDPEFTLLVMAIRVTFQTGKLDKDFIMHLKMNLLPQKAK